MFVNRQLYLMRAALHSTKPKTPERSLRTSHVLFSLQALLDTFAFAPAEVVQFTLRAATAL